MRLHKPTTTPATTGEIAILSRILANGREFSPTLARELLRRGFSPDEIARINDLASGNREGELSAPELAELRDYARAGCLLGVLHAKARRALRKYADK